MISFVLPRLFHFSQLTVCSLLMTAMFVAGCSKKGHCGKKPVHATSMQEQVTYVPSSYFDEQSVQLPAVAVPQAEIPHLTADGIRKKLPDFNKEIDHACSRCAMGDRVPKCFLSNFQKRQLTLGPAVRAIKSNRPQMEHLLTTPEAVAFINAMIDEFDVLIKQKLSKSEIEIAFLDWVDSKKGTAQFTQMQEAAIGFAYCWLFRF
jgi:hypothetical protein